MTVENTDNTQTSLQTPAATESEAIQEYNAWRAQRNLPPILPHNIDPTRQQRSIYLSHTAYTNLQQLSLAHTGRPNVSGLLEMLGLGIFTIERNMYSKP